MFLIVKWYMVSFLRSLNVLIGLDFDDTVFQELGVGSAASPLADAVGGQLQELFVTVGCRAFLPLLVHCAAAPFLALTGFSMMGFC